MRPRGVFAQVLRAPGNLRALEPLRDLRQVRERHAHRTFHAPDAGDDRIEQRLCIARCIAIRPEVLLLDEPCSALDPISTAKIEELIHELKSDYTVVIVTHNMQQAARVSDYTAYMYLGELIEYGVTDEIFIKPKKKQTEDYITGRFG